MVYLSVVGCNEFIGRFLADVFVISSLGKVVDKRSEKRGDLEGGTRRGQGEDGGSRLGLMGWALVRGGVEVGGDGGRGTMKGGSSGKQAG